MSFRATLIQHGISDLKTADAYSAYVDAHVKRAERAAILAGLTDEQIGRGVFLKGYFDLGSA